MTEGGTNLEKLQQKPLNITTAALGKSLGDVDKKLVDSAKALREGKISYSEFQVATEQATSSQSKFSSTMSKLKTGVKNFAGTFVSSIASFGIGMAASAIITKGIELIDDYIHRSEKLIEKGEEAKASIDSTFKTFSENKNSIENLGKSFAKIQKK